MLMKKTRIRRLQMTDSKKLLEILRNEQPLNDGSAPIGKIEEKKSTDGYHRITLPDHRIGFTFHNDTGKLAFIFNWE